MNKAKRNNISLALAFLLLLAPVFVSAQSTGGTQIAVPQGFNGIFSCNQNGSYAMSVGALGATGGVYVPVADASVELNTGTLVYKECVLREVVDAQRQSTTASLQQVATNNIQTGRGGASLAAVQPVQEATQAANAIVQTDLQQNGTLNTADPSLQTPVGQAVARGYVAATQQPNAQLKCTIPDNLQSVVNGQTTNANTLNDIAAFENPACNAMGATLLANNIVMQDVSAGTGVVTQELQWGNGYYPVTSGGANPLLQTIVTPSYNVSNSYATILNSGFNQLQSANDLGQMIGALYSGLSTQILSGNAGGIAGLNQPIGGSPSYFQQVVSQESQNLQSQIANTALVNLQAALQTEQSYYNLMNSIAGTLTQTINQLRSSENTCWQQISQALCPSGVSNGSCTDINGAQLKIATSTEFSQAIINSPNSQIQTLASTTENNLQVSQQALSLINQLIRNVSGSSADAQALAIEQLNTLISNNELHTPSDLTTAQSQAQSVTNAMQTLTQNTASLWVGTDPNNTTNNNIPWNGSVGATFQLSDPGVGWCNANNKTTLQAWENAWRS